MKNKIRNFIINIKIPAAFLLLCILVICIFGGVNDIGRAGIISAYMSLVMTVIVAVSAIIFICRKEKLKFCTAENCNLISLTAGVMLRLFYILYTDGFTRQHDEGSFDVGIGHYGYMKYIYDHNALPDTDPRDAWQFYHPPLHHATEALWFKILSAFGVPEDKFYDYAQYPVFIYSCVIMFTIYCIFRELDLKGKGLLAATALICFSPSFILMTGSVNNDMLSIMFICLAVLYTIKWYKNPEAENIIGIALSIGLGMMTKASVGLIAPSVAIVFVVKFVQQIKKKKIGSYIFQYIMFAVICVPPGLWWSVRNYTKFRLPFNYIAEINIEGNAQYLGEMDTLKRFTDFSLYQFKSVFVQWLWDDDKYQEFNPLIAFFKTLCFDEKNFLNWNSKLDTAPVILFWSSVIIGIISVIAMIYVIFSRKSSCPMLMKIFLSAIFITFFGNYIVFCIKYPFTCTMNIRYVTPVFIPAAYFTGAAVENISKSAKKPAAILEILILSVVMTFCSSTAFVYTALACIQ